MTLWTLGWPELPPDIYLPDPAREGQPGPIELLDALSDRPCETGKAVIEKCVRLPPMPPIKGAREAHPKTRRMFARPA